MYKEIKPFIFSLIILALGYASIASAAPSLQYFRTMLPVDSTENVGTSTARWDEGWFNTLNVTSCTGCLSGAFAWPFTKQAGGEQATSTVLGTYGGLLSLSSTTLIGDFTVPALTSAITLTGAGGLFAEYTGTSCTNQFPRSLSALGAATCASVASTDVDSSIALSATTITVAGTANQITSSAGAQDLTANRTWTLSIPSPFVISLASTTQLSAGGAFFGQTATSTFSSTGALLVVASTTLQNATSSNFFTSANHISIGQTGGEYVSATSTLSLNIASSTLVNGASYNRATTTIQFAPWLESRKIVGASCMATSTGGVLFQVGGKTTLTAALFCDGNPRTYTFTAIQIAAFSDFLNVQVMKASSTADRASINIVTQKVSD